LEPPLPSSSSPCTPTERNREIETDRHKEKETHSFQLIRDGS
jgi:hypothetical protein